MKHLAKTLSILLLIYMYNLNAQQVVKKDTLSGTELTIAMDSRINDELEKVENNCLRIAENKLDKNDDDNAIKTTKPKIIVPNRALTNAEICNKNPRILGFKIQINTVKSNNEANEVKTYFRRRFPNLKVETDASLRPNYKILAGSYFSKQSAASDLSRIREFFKSAIVVEYRVFCAEAK